MVKYGTARRKIKSRKGNTDWITVQRMRCKICNRTIRMLPDSVVRFKHYEREVIIGVVEGLITADTLGFEDYPCEMTMKRWIRNF